MGDQVLNRVPEGYVHVPTGVAQRHPRGFFCEVDGGGMSRVFPDGSMILIDPDVEPRNGSVVAVELEDGEPYVRRWYRGRDTLLLTADGYEEREDMVFRGDSLESVRLLGTVVWYQSNGEVE